MAVGEDWWMERRFVEPAAQRWWTSIGKDPATVFDRCFLEREALRAFKNAEDGLSKPTTTIEDHHHSQNSQSQRDVSDDHVEMSQASNAGNMQRIPSGPVSRAIQHPLFRNCDFKGAEEYLQSYGTVGDMIMRPSSKGGNMLAITWYFYDNLFKHFDVEEHGRRPGGSTALGNILRIVDYEETFSDIDQIYQLYITPMNDFVTSMITQKFFREGSIEDVESYLFEQRRENPNKMHYCIRFEPSKPGNFTLTWLSLNAASTTPIKKELIGVTPSVCHF